MTKYQLTVLDSVLWRDFKALAATEGTTIKAKLISYISAEVHVFRGRKALRAAEKKYLSIGGNKK